MAFTFQIIGVIFAVFMILLSYSAYKKRRFTTLEFVFWCLFWIGGTVLIVARNTFNSILGQLDILRVMDLYMILAFMFLFSLVFWLFLKNSETERRMEKLARAVTLKPLRERLREEE